MKNALVRAFAEANVPLALAHAPLEAVNADIFQMDITEDRARIRIWRGASTNRVDALSADPDFRQVLMAVQEPSRTFQRKFSKRDSMTPPSGPNLRILRQTPYNWIAEMRTVSVDRLFLCGQDETHLFIAQVREGNTVAEAHESLKPGEVLAAEREGRGPILRQGEWFFVPAKPREITWLQRNAWIEHNTAIEQGTQRPHLAEELALFEELAYARGDITHVDHRTLTLPTWHEVVRNTEVVDPGRRRGILWID